ncbi:MAG: bifunctional phosphoglucose/phosphomannose isomerase [Candidatus Omnitrophica bacterium]|nr:bifunctional phosphoglucose/phosphomannose isomerase [Candidatus Omnitrophota bacterium]
MIPPETEILDNLDLIKGIDKSNLLKHLLNFPQQCKEARAIGKLVKLPKSYMNYNNIVLSGLGGSAIGADLVRSYIWAHFKKSIYINRNYTLPGFIGSSTVLFCLSYSGDTEETISSYYNGKRKNAKSVILTSGGKLKKIAIRDNIPHIIIPKGLPPRQALGYSFFPLLYAISKISGLKPDEGPVEETLAYLEHVRTLFKPQQKTRENLAKRIALKLHNKLPLIYGTQDHMDTIVLRFRNQLEENSKHISFSHLFPEMNHNEIVGWENPKVILRNIAVVLFRDKEDYPRTKLRIDITKKIIKRYTNTIIEIHSLGNCLLSRMFYLIYLGDFVSFYLAILNNVDPTPVDKVKYLKDRLARFKTVG